MELKPFTIVALPFEYSNVESEYTVYGTDEEDAVKDFRQRHPTFRVKEIKPQ